MRRMTKWYLLFFLLLVMICAFCIWYAIVSKTGEPGNAELVQSQPRLIWQAVHEKGIQRR